MLETEPVGDARGANEAEGSMESNMCMRSDRHQSGVVLGTLCTALSFSTVIEIFQTELYERIHLLPSHPNTITSNKESPEGILNERQKFETLAFNNLDENIS